MKRSSWLEHVVSAEEAGMTVERVIREKMAVSGRMLQRLTRSKGIQLNRKPPYLQRTVKEGDRIRVRIADKAADLPAPAAGKPAGIDLDILYEDEQYIIVNKPAGMMVHPVNPEQSGTLVHRLAAYLRQRGEAAAVHAVHRLDKETTGAILLAKSGYAHQLADRMLREGALKREYVAVVCGQIKDDQGTVEAPIARDPSHPTRRRVDEKGEPAITHYAVLARSARATLVRVWLETGRTHQIRVHFAHLGHPLAGDRLYGGTRFSFSRQALHAYRLALRHPVDGREIDVTAALPEDMIRFIQPEFHTMVNALVVSPDKMSQKR
ncbi:RluA family pseudouridine synthase [Brevibacillus sp. SYP-B805]|uniref:RluA family pseudouridine synthase n=1 Tax=Brevibacillus sp. SYP-B805 TaxID=1578199 RepID=UPI0032172BAF